MHWRIWINYTIHIIFWTSKKTNTESAVTSSDHNASLRYIIHWTLNSERFYGFVVLYILQRLYTYIVHVVYIEREKKWAKLFGCVHNVYCKYDAKTHQTNIQFKSACGLRNQIRVCRKRKPKLPLEFRNGMFCFVRSAGHRSLNLSYPIVAAKFLNFHQWISQRKLHSSR